jgi:hypothetical protein
MQSPCFARNDSRMGPEKHGQQAGSRVASARRTEAAAIHHASKPVDATASLDDRIDIVDEGSTESFPVTDPPTWTAVGGYRSEGKWSVAVHTLIRRFDEEPGNGNDAW